MNKTFTLSIPQACSEDFEQFQTTSQGGFCQSCQKEVIDFSQMSEQEIKAYFQKPRANACGRFKESQLKSYTPVLAQTPKFTYSWLKAGLLGLSILALAPLQTGQAQTKPKQTQEPLNPQSHQDQEHLVSQTSPRTYQVSGQVIDLGGDEPLIGASVFLKGTKVGVPTDLDGKFEFPKPLKKGDVLVFQYVGYKQEEYTIPENSLETMYIEIEMQFDESIQSSPIVIGMVWVDENAKKKKTKKSKKSRARKAK